jgi:hypothetical protein
MRIAEELLDSLMQRFDIPTMTAHLDDLRGIPGQLPGETLDRFALPVRVVIDDRQSHLAILLKAHPTGKHPVGLLLAPAPQHHRAIGLVGPGLSKRLAVECLPLPKHQPRLLTIRQPGFAMPLDGLNYCRGE